MKTYVITLSKNFLSNHPKAGQLTGFEEAIIAKRKIHTIRTNYPLWEKRITEIQRGEAVLSLREWTGKPYRSKQREILQLAAEDGVGIQKIFFNQVEWEDNSKPCYCYWINTGENEIDIDIDTIASNDGFEDPNDFIDWFIPAISKQKPDKDSCRTLECTVIHFSPLRYADK